MSARSIRRNADRTAKRRARRVAVATGAAIASGVVLASPASAADFTVGTLADPGNGDTCAATDCSLREAIEEADTNSEADTITFASGLSGEITLQNPLEVNSVEGISIEGPGVDVVSISGDTDTDDVQSAGDTDILRVDGSVSIADLTLKEGYYDSGGKYSGAITMYTESDVAIEDAALIGNAAPYFGGAITNRQGTLTITGSTISGNSSVFGGAIFAAGPKYTPTSPVGQAPGATTTITDSVVEDNGTVLPSGGPPATTGGAIISSGAKYTSEDPIPEKGQLTITGTTISGNQAEDGLGGALIAKYGETTIDDSEVTGNTAGAASGVALLGGDTEITRTAISGNNPNAGSTINGFAGGLSKAKYGQLDVRDSTISGNSSDGAGGVAVSMEGAGKYAAQPADIHASFVRTTVSGNTADSYGGGGFAVGSIPTGAVFELRDSTVSGNSAPATEPGGGFYFYDFVAGDASISNSTISGNSAGYGGGLSVGYLYSPPPASPVATYGSPTIENSTIAANTAAVSGGGIYLGGYNTDPGTAGSPSASADVPLSSTIVADNTGGDLGAATVDQPGNFELGYSLVETAGTAPTTQTPAGSSILGSDPQLGTLANNGGPTQTQLPAKASPVVDKGVANGLSTDQRGLARTVNGGTDIGSVEIQADPTPPDTTGPVITINKKPKSKLGTRKAKRRVRIGFRSNEPGSTFEVKINGGDYRPLDRPFREKLKAKRGKGAKYRIQIRGTDPAGNTGAPVGVKVKVVRKG